MRDGPGISANAMGFEAPMLGSGSFGIGVGNFFSKRTYRDGFIER